MTAFRRAGVGYPAAALLVGLTVGLLKLFPGLTDSSVALLLLLAVFLSAWIWQSGPGLLADVRSIQRLDTVGGTAPAQGCDRDNASREARVPYTATYYFYTGPRAATVSAASATTPR